MADNEEDLVSNIRVDGGDEAQTTLDKFADKGVAAFDRLAAAAEKASKRIEKSVDNIEKDADDAAAAQDKLGNAGVKGYQATGANLKDLERSVASFTSKIPQTIERVSQFIKKVALVGTAAAAAAVGVVAAAKKVAAAVDGQSNALEKTTQQQIDANNAALQGELAQINHESALRALNKQMASGAITYVDYIKQVRALNDQYNEQRRVAAEVEAAQARVKDENDALQKKLADRKAYEDLINTLGGPLTTALTSLGRQTSAIQKGFIDAFGPSAANIIDTISATLSKNGAAIQKFFDDASGKINDLLTKNAPQIERALEAIGAGAKNVFEGLIDALPALLDFFNNQLIPAIKDTMSVLNAFADAINFVFGTRLTGGFIVLIAIIGSATGAFKAIFSVITLGLRGVIALVTLVSAAFGISFGAAALIVAGLAAALYLLYTQVDWTAFGQKVVAAWQSIVQWFNNAKTSGQNAANAIQEAWNGIVNWFSTTWASITGTVSAVWTGIQDGAQAVVDFLGDLWNGFVDTLNGIVSGISDAFKNGLNTIKSYWQSSIDAIKGFLSGLYNSAIQFLQPIIDMLKTILALGGSDGGGASAAAFAGGGSVTGPGTGTSDSIPAWLSNGEFVVRAKAVQKYGASFLNRINSGALRFAQGGLVGASPVSPASAYHDGQGAADGPALTPLNLSLFGEEFQGLLMPQDVGRRLTKFAIAKQTRSAGRKPAWIGRGRT